MSIFPLPLGGAQGVPSCSCDTDSPPPPPWGAYPLSRVLGGSGRIPPPPHPRASMCCCCHCSGLPVSLFLGLGRQKGRRLWSAVVRGRMPYFCWGGGGGRTQADGLPIFRPQGVRVPAFCRWGQRTGHFGFSLPGGGGGGSIEPPKTGGGGVREKGSIDRHH